MCVALSHKPAFCQVGFSKWSVLPTAILCLSVWLQLRWAKSFGKEKVRVPFVRVSIQSPSSENEEAMVGGAELFRMEKSRLMKITLALTNM